MSDSVNTQDGEAMSPASVGSQPVAWAAFADASEESGVTSLNRADVDEVATRMGWKVAPLYRQLTLTDAEREAIDWAAYAAEQWYEHTAAATLRGLLERAG